MGDASAYQQSASELAKLKDPTMMAVLPEKFDLPRAGPVENVEEIASETDYYDGSTKLNKKVIHCRLYGNASECMKNSACGWCGSNHSCILGNNLGPLQACSRSSFLYSSPVSNLNLGASVVESEDGGVKFVLNSK